MGGKFDWSLAKPHESTKLTSKKKSRKHYLRLIYFSYSIMNLVQGGLFRSQLFDLFFCKNNFQVSNFWYSFRSLTFSAKVVLELVLFILVATLYWRNAAWLMWLCVFSLQGPNFMVEWLTLLLHILGVRVQIWTRRPAILIEVIRGFPYSLQANDGIVP
jgi:hypothetical protein